MQILTGTFVGFWPSAKGKLKYIRITDGAQEYQVKLPKYMRAGLARELQPGMGVKVAVRWHEGGWQATDILLFRATEPFVGPTLQMTTPACRVQVCQKGSCRKQGSLALLQELSEKVRERGWDEWVFVEGSGCQNACKHGPNVCIDGRTLHHAQVSDVLVQLAQRLPQTTPGI
ncbi:MAG: (2Fe-2S) ferredoxin domain-containing protein [Gloeomargarita sp. SKYB31]|nr:(2Fe-2S) ferredoxin domain-containing protein [Gloeomargarita sp. SKYB31]